MYARKKKGKKRGNPIEKGSAADDDDISTQNPRTVERRDDSKRKRQQTIERERKRERERTTTKRIVLCESRAESRSRVEQEVERKNGKKKKPPPSESEYIHRKRTASGIPQKKTRNETSFFSQFSNPSPLRPEFKINRGEHRETTRKSTTEYSTISVPYKAAALYSV